MFWVCGLNLGETVSPDLFDRGGLKRKTAGGFPEGS
jgi:hypothetical protein